MKTNAYAKVNLALDILGQNENGYHLMDMVNTRAGLHDVLTITPAEKDEVICTSMKLPERNTLTRTLDALRPYGLKNHYRIELEKNIPEQAGLGGGSADAAALLKALSELESLDLSLEQLEKIGFAIGADVPCCLHEGFTRVSSMGEIVRDLPVDWQIPILLVQGAKGISTKEAFARFDEHPAGGLDIDIVSDAVSKKDIGLLYQTMTNALEKQAFDGLDELVEMKEDMLDAGLVRVMMSGSGSVLMGFCVDDDVMEEAAEILRQKYPFVWKGTAGPC